RVTERRFPVVDHPLVRRIERVVRGRTASWLGALRNRPGNPLGIELESFGAATAFLARHLPAPAWSPRFNFVLGLEPSDGQLEDVLEFYRSHGVRPGVKRLPGDLTPSLGSRLAAQRFYQSDFHVRTCGTPAMLTPATPTPAAATGVTVRPVGA